MRLLGWLLGAWARALAESFPAPSDEELEAAIEAGAKAWSM